jgi:hypothetical protein
MHMAYDRAPLKIFAALTISFITGLGCTGEDVRDDAALESTDSASAW